jgi:hypothetical protein
MSYNMMLGYDIYDYFTMEHFRLRQRMTLTTKIYCSPLYVLKVQKKKIRCQIFETNGNTFLTFLSKVRGVKKITIRNLQG